MDGIALLKHRMSALVNDALVKKRQELTIQTANLAALSPKAQLEKKKQELAVLRGKLREQIHYRVLEKKNQNKLLRERLLACDLVSILNRGYAIARKNGKAFSSIKEINPGDEIAIQLKDGTIYAAVTRKEG